VDCWGPLSQVRQHWAALLVSKEVWVAMYHDTCCLLFLGQWARKAWPSMASCSTQSAQLLSLQRRICCFEGASHGHVLVEQLAFGA
jgi:hypothetical protein